MKDWGSRKGKDKYMWSDNMDIYDWWSEPREISLRVDPEALRLYWTTKDGAKIFIEDMETSHIENIVKAGLEGRMNCTENTEARFLLELSLRYRQAQTEPVGKINLQF